MVQRPESATERKERRIDLSLPQVAGSAVAAVAAALMASRLGVYGTILGAGVMSVVATCGGSVFQHFFRRTGEQIRVATVQVKHPAVREPGPAGTRRPESGPLPDGAFSTARTHGTRVRGRKRSALAAVAVFVLAMAGITTYERISGNGLSGGGTTVGTVVSGGRDAGPAAPGPSGGGDGEQGASPATGPADGSGSEPATAPGDGQDDQDPVPGRTDGSTAVPTPEPSGNGDGDGESGGSGEGAPTVEPTPVPGGSGSATPEPAESAGSDVPDQGAGAAGTGR